MKPLPTLTALLLALAACAPSPETTRDEALAFLYASMPLPDSVDYSRDFWLHNIDCALQARREMPWGATIPQREWRHFVLPVRVNNENLDTCRMVFYAQLKDRVRHLSMAEAILEVNHWCHEHVTYQPSDERTSSPLATLRTAYGRCGEESTLLVAALRSVGIPARQVYTPRWAHTDDNHAWVEAWADGEWHFLGACEPEPVLDLGWFNQPASRAMLMHTKVFGPYDGPEEVMQRNACFTEIDVTSRCAPTGRSCVQVLDAEGRPVPNATVEFKIYNYAEFYTVARRQTDAQGIASMQAGLGDLLCWAHKGDAYGFDKVRIGRPDTLRLTLSHHPGESYSLDIDIVPPVERNTLPEVTPEQRALNTSRLAYEDSLRNAYVATFPASNDPLIQASRGNHAVIAAFLHPDHRPAGTVAPTLRRSLLQALTAKDLRDVTPDVLDDAFFGIDTASLEALDDFHVRYVLNPRVANEQLRPYKAFFARHIPPEQAEAWRADPQQLVAWIGENIQLDTTRNPQQLRMTPVGAWTSRRCDATSRDILFVALARTCRIPARIDPVTRKLQVAQMGTTPLWTDVHFAPSVSVATKFGRPSRPSAQGALFLTYAPTRYNPDPKYYTHFTLSQLQHGTAVLLNYGEDDTYRTLFGEASPALRRKEPQGIALDAGDYLLVSGTRLANGTVLVHVEAAPVQPGQLTRLPLVLRRAETELQVIGSFNSENLYNDRTQGTRSLLSTTGRGYYILGILAPGNEPTDHALRDLAACSQALAQSGLPLVLLTRNEQEATALDKLDGLQHVALGTDIDHQILDELCTGMHLNGTLPIFIIADTFNRVVFLSEGYTIGLGEQLVQAAASL